MLERKGHIQFHGKDAIVIGDDLKIGQQTPLFDTHLQDWSYLNIQKITCGKVRIIAAVPSIDSSDNDREIRKFCEEAANLLKDVSILVFCTDLPFAQKKLLSAADISPVLVVSDHLRTSFGKKYGWLHKDQRILQSAVFVIDRKYKITNIDSMKVVGDEPANEAALADAREAF